MLAKPQNSPTLRFVTHPERLCKGCRKPLPKDYRANRLYCSFGCRKQFEAKNYALLAVPRPMVPTGTVGAIHELLVCADLLRRGAMVFRAMSPSCACDLALLHQQKLFRIEVTTAYKKANGGKSFAAHNSKNYDILALVFHSGEIEYIPPLPTM